MVESPISLPFHAPTFDWAHHSNWWLFKPQDDAVSARRLDQQCCSYSSARQDNNFACRQANELSILLMNGPMIAKLTGGQLTGEPETQTGTQSSCVKDGYCLPLTAIPIATIAMSLLLRVADRVACNGSLCLPLSLSPLPSTLHR